MTTQADISSRITSALALSDPGLDTSIGAPVRKIIDAVAASMAEATIDSHLTSYAYDIDSKTGGDLDDFVALFGLARLQARRASGVVTFSRDSATAAAKISSIGSGAQIMAMTSPIVFVQTIASAVLALGQTSVDVPVQAINAGVAGNVASGTLINLASTIDGVISVTNAAALIGGAAAETDDQLRARFKSTVFRNLAGTEAMYRAMALQVQADPSDPSSTAVTQVNVIGSKVTWTERIAVVSGTATSTLTDAAYIYPGSVFVGSNISQGNFLTPTQFTVTINNVVSPATLSVASVGVNMPDGFYDLQYDYVPLFSRNDPLSTRFGDTGANITNRVDVWVNGVIVESATQTCVFTTSAGMQFNAIANDPLQATRFTRLLTGTAPAVSDYFVPLGFGPITSVPSSMVIASSTYVRGTHYDVVHQSDAFGYSPTSAFGLVFFHAGAVPPSNTPFSLTYSFNSVPASVQSSIESTWRLLGTDVQIHAGQAVLMTFNLAVMYDPTYDQSSVQTAIQVALSNLVSGLGFNSALQVADVLQTVHNVPGVLNVRFLNNADDGTNYAMQSQTLGGSVTTYQSAGRAVDVLFNDASYPVANTLRIIAKARNNFGTP